uniref:Platelet-derived growth factor (PDGF) family profile domain-containing protein n=1 Tax=Clytia hemisphaerica TaxID=252671 RepID=A0A7M5UY54_9CNID
MEFCSLISWYFSICWLISYHVKLGLSSTNSFVDLNDSKPFYHKKRVLNMINFYRRRKTAKQLEEKDNDSTNKVKKIKSKDMIPIAYQIPKCEPRSTIISIDKAQTSEGYTLFPHCIMADRCGGCCREGNMDCVADELKTKSVYVYKVAKGFTADKITSLQKVDYINHESCKCKHKLYINQ